MSPIPTIFGMKERRSSVPEFNDDLERGPTAMTLPRESRSAPQSFNVPDNIPHLPERYQEAMDAIEGKKSASMDTEQQLDEYAWSPRQSEDSNDNMMGIPLQRNSISSTDLSWLLGSEVGIPAGGLAKDSDISRFSGIVSDGTSQRAMSEAELRNSLHSLHGIIESGLGRDESSSSQAGPMAALGESEADYLHEAHTSSSQSGGRDWETVSDMRGAMARLNSEDATQARTGSSLADNSDSGNISLPKKTSLYGGSPILQHPSHPRFNQSYMIVRDHRTGQSFSVPQADYELRNRIPNANSAKNFAPNIQSRNYHHPIPLLEGHPHPFTTSPPAILPIHQSSATAQMNDSTGKQAPAVSESLSSDMSDGNYNNAKDEQKVRDQRKSLYELTNPKPKDRKDEVDRSQRELSSKERSYHSSTWVSTQSDDESAAYALPPVPGRQGSFAKLAILGVKGNITGSPDGAGAREVGSSLADASSPGAQFSSSPAPVNTSPTSQFRTAPVASTSQTSASGTHSPHTTASFATEPNAIDDFQMPKTKEEWLQVLPPMKKQELASMSSTRRRRSSSESESDHMASPSARLASAREPSILRGHERSNTSAGLLSETASISQYDESVPASEFPNLRERRGHEANVDDRSTSSFESRAFRDRNGVIHTDNPAPEFIHPVYGRDRPWDRNERQVRPNRPQPGRGRPRNPGTGIRPIARAESPHLHRVPRPLTTEVLERRKLISTIYLIPCCCIPFMAMLYGYGMIDWVINAHMDGEIEGWNEAHVTFARYWGPVVIIGYIIAIIIAWAIL